MNKLSKEKRDKLILTILAVIGVLGVLYTFVLGAQQDALYTLQTQIASASDKVSKAERLVKSAEIVEANLAESKAALEQRMEDMAPQGQYYYWFLKLLDEFRKSQNLNTGFIVDITQPEFIEVGLIPKFPFRAASFGVRLHGGFQEVGKFIADLENSYPYFRVQNPRAATQAAGLGQPLQALERTSASDKLIVELRVITLIKPGTT